MYWRCGGWVHTDGTYVDRSQTRTERRPLLGRKARDSVFELGSLLSAVVAQDCNDDSEAASLRTIPCFLSIFPAVERYRSSSCRSLVASSFPCSSKTKRCCSTLSSLFLLLLDPDQNHPNHTMSPTKRNQPRMCLRTATPAWTKAMPRASSRRTHACPLHYLCRYGDIRC